MRLTKTACWLAVLALECLFPLLAQNQVNLTVDSKMDIYKAGGYDDGSDGVSPVVFSFPARAGRLMTVPSIGGGWSCQSGYPSYGADGETSGYCVDAGRPTNVGAVGPFSGYHLTDFVGGLAGVFLEDSLPATAPAPLRFFVADNSAGGIQTDFKILSPQIGQIACGRKQTGRDPLSGGPDPDGRDY